MSDDRPVPTGPDAAPDPERRRLLSRLALGSLLGVTTWRAGADEKPGPAPLPEHFPWIPSAATPNNRLSPQRVPYPPCDENLKTEIDAVLKRTEQMKKDPPQDPRL